LTRQIRKILEEDSKEPESLESLLQKLSKELPEAIYLERKYIIERRKLLAGAWQKWFQYLGWWFARLLMYGTLVAAISFSYLYGKNAVTPLTWSLLGAAGYYALIQIFTPMRIKREVEALESSEEENLQDLIANNYEEKTD
jgi:hypothetical protein